MAATRPAIEPDRVDLSVVFVTRNEEEKIGECIHSTIEAVEEARRAGAIRTVEFILVDSASRDRTVEIAARFPIRIVMLEPDWPLSCGAGCFVGIEHSRGTFTAVVNGDVVIDRGWIVGVLAYMAPDVAGVCGVATEDLLGRTPVERMIQRSSGVPDLAGPLPPKITSHPGGYSTGTIVLRTDAARKAGSYNPFFRAAEDMDLRYRLLHAGWRVLNVPVHQGRHHWAAGRPLDVLDYFWTIYRNSVGLGQMARFELSRDRWVAHRASTAAFNLSLVRHGLMAIGMASLLALHVYAFLSGTLPPILLVVGADVTTGAWIAYAARRARLSVLDYLFSSVLVPPLFGLVRVIGFLRGFLLRPQGPAQYPKGARTLIGETSRAN